MSDVTSKICKMVTSEQPELQCAAAMVIAELGVKDAAVKKALSDALKTENESVQIYAAEALGRLGIKESLSHLLPLLKGSSQLKLKASQVIQSFGPEIAESLEKNLSTNDQAVRKGILEILGHFGGAASLEPIFRSLLDRDAEVVTQAVQVIKNRYESLNPEEQTKTAKHLLSVMNSKEVRKDKAAVVPFLRVLGLMKNPAHIKIIAPYLDRKQPEGVRLNALLAMSNYDAAVPLSQEIVRKLLEMLDEEQTTLITSALNILWKLNLGKPYQEKVLKLLDSPHQNVKLFAIKALGQIGSPPAAKALVPVVMNPDAKIQEMAVSALRSNTAFVPVLIRELLGVKDLAFGWKLASALKGHKNAIDRKTVKKFLARCMILLDKKEGSFQLYFEILRGTQPEVLRDAILKKGQQLLKKKKAAEAERYLGLLERDDLATNDSVYALALCQLKLANKDLAMAGRDKSHAMFLFSRLLRRDSFPLVKKLKGESRLLTPEDCLYLGFHFIEKMGIDRELGSEVLKFTAKRYARTQEGKIAKHKLRTQGITE